MADVGCGGTGGAPGDHLTGELEFSTPSLQLAREVHWAASATQEDVWVGLEDGRIFRSVDRGDRFSEIAFEDAQRSRLRGLRHLVAW